VAVHHGRGQQIGVTLGDPLEELVPAAGIVHVVLAQPELVGVEAAEHRDHERVEVAALHPTVLGHRGVARRHHRGRIRVGEVDLGVGEGVAAQHEVPGDQ
jgi:hypothetical protein